MENGKLTNVERQHIWSKGKISKITGTNRQYTDDFLTALGMRKYSERTIIRYREFLSYLWNISKKDWKKLSRQDVNAIVTAYAKGKAESTKVVFSTQLKVLLKWLAGLPWKSKETPKNCLDLDCVMPQTKVTKESLITAQEIQLIVDKARCVRDKALLWLGWETGARSGEVSLMNVGDVLESGPDGVLVRIKTLKVGKRKNGNGEENRTCRIVFGAPDLVRWVREHPTGQPSDPLWITRQGNRMISNVINDVLVFCARRARLGRRTFWHVLRHTAASRISRRCSDAILRKQMGWQAGSAMTGRYSHISDSEADQEVRQAVYGQKVETKGDALDMVRCPACQFLNLGQPQFCNNCNVEISPKMQERIADNKATDFVMGELMKNPQVIQAIKEIKETRKEELAQIYGE